MSCLHRQILLLAHLHMVLLCMHICLRLLGLRQFGRVEIFVRVHHLHLGTLERDRTIVLASSAHFLLLLKWLLLLLHGRIVNTPARVTYRAIQLLHLD